MSSTQQLLLGEGAGGSGPAVYIEDVFSTYLYTGTGSAQTITNGIDFSTKGGLLWLKARNDTRNNWLYDTTRSIANGLRSDSTAAATSTPDALTAFNNNGFSIGTSGNINTSGNTLVSWSFREQPKFFDVVTYTGNGGVQNIAHNLGSVPGCIIVKSTSQVSNWAVYHTSLGNTQFLALNQTNAATTLNYWNDTSPTSTQFTVNGYQAVGSAGQTYVAYLFAHNAGGFGLTGTDNVISCGSFTTDGSGNATVTLGYEPQWVVIKNTTSPENWFLNDIMRGMPAPPSGSGTNVNLFPNTSAAESIQGYDTSPTATGFAARTGNPSQTYIYIAIRRGPMKVPTSGTSVFMPVATTANGATSITANFPVDLSIIKARANAYNWWWSDRLRGNQYAAYLGISRFLFSNSTDSEQVYTDTTPGVMMASNTGIIDYAVLPSGYTGIYYNFRRAPSVFDIVCFTGDGTSDRSINHNLGVVPELFFTKRRSSGGSGDVNWGVYSKDRPSANYNLILNSDTGWYNAGTGGWFGTGTLSATLFPAGRASGNFGNLSGATYVTYLFASCPGVSKVGSYTGTGVDTTIDCGFVDGARLVLIKETSSADNWAIFDSARGYATSSDPYLALNAADAESTGNWLLFRSEGFGVRSSSFVGGSLNVLGQTYIFLAIA